MHRHIFCSCHCISTTANRCSYSIPFEEYFTWILLGFIAIFFYKTIQICLITCFIVFILFWLIKQFDIPCLVKDYLEKRSTRIKTQTSDQSQTINENSEIKINQEKSLLNTIDQDSKELINSADPSEMTIERDSGILNDIHQRIESLHEDILQLKAQFHQPKCIPLQPSLEMNSLMPRVPRKSAVVTNDEIDQDEGKSFDNYIDTSKPLITTTEQYENIPKNSEKRSSSTLILKDSMIYQNDQPDWVSYSTKPDLFPNRIQSDLPIVHSDNDQHLSLKQTILSHFHRQPKFPPSSTLHSTSLNARIDRQQSIVDNIFYEKISLHLISNQLIEQLKQRIVRVRKNRMIFSFDSQDKQAICQNNSYVLTISCS